MQGSTLTCVYSSAKGLSLLPPSLRAGAVALWQLSPDATPRPASRRGELARSHGLAAELTLMLCGELSPVQFKETRACGKE